MKAQSQSFAALIRKLQLHSPLTNEDISLLLSLESHQRCFSRGEEIVPQGSYLDDIYVIEKGWACRSTILIDGTLCILGFLLPGDTSDINNALVAKTDHSIRAVTEVEAIRVNYSDLKDVLHSSPSLTRAFSRAKMAIEASQRALLVGIAHLPATTRLAHFLCEMTYRMHGIADTPSEKRSVPLTQIELGSALGMSNVHVNRVIRTLREQDLVAVGPANITVVDWEGLATFSQFSPAYLDIHFASAAVPKHDKPSTASRVLEGIGP